MRLRALFLLAAMALPSCGNRSTSAELQQQFGKDKDVAQFVRCAMENYQTSIAACEIERSRIDTPGRVSGISPTAWLAEKGFLTPNSLTELIKKGIDLHDPNAPAGTTLGYIVEEYPIEYLKTILKTGFDVNSCQYKYNKDTCIIFSTIDSSDIEKLKLIVENGADIEKVDEFFGETPLLYSMSIHNFDAAVYLLDQGANVSAVTRGKKWDFCWHVENLSGFRDLLTKSEDAPSEENRIFWLGKIRNLKDAIDRHKLGCGKVAGLY